MARSAAFSRGLGLGFFFWFGRSHEGIGRRLFAFLRGNMLTFFCGAIVGAIVGILVFVAAALFVVDRLDRDVIKHAEGG